LGVLGLGREAVITEVVNFIVDVEYIWYA